jgi:HlyD family secretion protein
MIRRLWKPLLFILLTVVAGGALLAFLNLRPLPVRVVEVEHDVPVQVFGLGTVEARIRSQIGFEVGGALAELHADHGDRVAQGDVLARLHSTEQEARVAKARAGLSNAEAYIQRAEAGVERARAVLAQREASHRRNQSLLQRDMVSSEVAEEAQLARDNAMAELAVARADVDVARAALESARAQYALDSVLLDYYTLRAPYGATVVARHKETGSVLAPGEPLFTLIDPQTVWGLAYIDEARAMAIREGQPAVVRLRSMPRQPLPAHVVRIDIESDRVNEERRVYVACDQCPERFFLGEQLEVLITTDRLTDALLVPEIAISGFDGTEGTVWTVEDDRLHRRRVSFGQQTLDGRLEIVAGLPEGALVVGELRDGLREGRTVRIGPEDTR